MNRIYREVVAVFYAECLGRHLQAGYSCDRAESIAENEAKYLSRAILDGLIIIHISVARNLECPYH